MLPRCYAAAVLGPLLGVFAASALQVDHVPFDMSWTGDGSVDTWDTVSKWSGGALPGGSGGGGSLTR